MEKQFSYIPHTDEDIQSMLQAVGVSSIDELFSDIPNSVKISHDLSIPEGVSEHQALEQMKQYAGMNVLHTSFLGCGIYDHIIPSAVKQVFTTPAFVTSYTPYQPEMSQGLLQGIFEFQSLICRLTGMDVSNASLYDGHTAAAEAAAIALQTRKKADELLVSEAVHPFTLRVLQTYYQDSGITIRTIPVKDGRTSRKELQEMVSNRTAAVILQTPNLFGVLEDFTGFADDIHQHKALCVISANPMTLGVCKNQNAWGADIAIGDTQPFGLPSSFGGPTVGYIAANEKLLRKMPGRIVGETTDTDGNLAFVLTLQAREQHIKRERATSNICSNQALAALASTAYLSLVGPGGLKEAGTQCIRKAHYLHARLTELSGITPFCNAPFFHEFCIDFGTETQARNFLARMQEKNMFAGVHLGDMSSQWNGIIAVAVTEKRTRKELDSYVEYAREVLS